LKEKLSRAGATVDGTKAQMSVEDPAMQIRQLLDLFHAEGVTVKDLTLKSATLEQVFLQRTGRELRE
jgi:hypothetical protein